MLTVVHRPQCIKIHHQTLRSRNTTTPVLVHRSRTVTNTTESTGSKGVNNDQNKKKSNKRFAEEKITFPCTPLSYSSNLFQQFQNQTVERDFNVFKVQYEQKFLAEWKEVAALREHASQLHKSRLRKELAKAMLPYKILKWNDEADQEMFNSEPTPYPEPWEVHPARLPPRVRKEDMPPDWRMMDESISFDWSGGMEDEMQAVEDLKQELAPTDAIRDEMELSNPDLVDLIRKQLLDLHVETKPYGSFERALKIQMQNDKLVPDDVYDTPKEKLDQYQLKTLRQAQKYINALQQNPDVDLDDIDKDYIIEERKRIESQMAKEYEEIRKAEVGQAESERIQSIKLGEPTKYEIMKIRDRMNLLLKRIEILEIKLEDLGEIPESLWPLKPAYDIKSWHDDERAKYEASNWTQELPNVNDGLEELVTGLNQMHEIYDMTKAPEDEEEEVEAEAEAEDPDLSSMAEQILEADAAPFEDLEQEAEAEDIVRADYETQVDRELRHRAIDADPTGEVLDTLTAYKKAEYLQYLKEMGAENPLEEEEAEVRAMKVKEFEKRGELEADDFDEEETMKELGLTDDDMRAETTLQATFREMGKDVQEEEEFEDEDLAEDEKDLDEDFEQDLEEEVERGHEDVEQDLEEDVEREEEVDEDADVDDIEPKDIDEKEFFKGLSPSQAARYKQELDEIKAEMAQPSRAELRRQKRAERKAAGKKANIDDMTLDDETQYYEEEKDFEQVQKEYSDSLMLDGSPFLETKAQNDPIRYDPFEIEQDPEIQRNTAKWRRDTIADELKFGADKTHEEGLDTFSKTEQVSPTLPRARQPKIALTMKQIQSLPDSEVRRYLYSLDKKYRAQLRYEDEFRGDDRLKRLAQEVEKDDAIFRAHRLAEYNLPPIESTRPDPWNTLIMMLEEFKREFGELTDQLQELHEELEEQRLADQLRYKSDAQGRPLDPWHVSMFDAPSHPTRGGLLFTNMTHPDTVGFALSYHKLLFDYQNNVKATTIAPMRSLDGISYPYYLWKATPFDIGPPEHRVGFTGVHQNIGTHQEMIAKEDWSPEEEAEFQRFVQAAKYGTQFSPEEVNEPLPIEDPEPVRDKEGNVVDVDNETAEHLRAQGYLEEEIDPLAVLEQHLEKFDKKVLSTELRSLKIVDDAIEGLNDEEYVEQKLMSEAEKKRYIKKRELSLQLRGLDEETKEFMEEKLYKPARELYKKKDAARQREIEKRLREKLIIKFGAPTQKREPGTLRPRKYKRTALEEIWEEERDPLATQVLEEAQDDFLKANLMLMFKKHPHLMEPDSARQEFYDKLQAEMNSKLKEDGTIKEEEMPNLEAALEEFEEMLDAETNPVEELPDDIGIERPVKKITEEEDEEDLAEESKGKETAAAVKGAVAATTAAEGAAAEGSEPANKAAAEAGEKDEDALDEDEDDIPDADFAELRDGYVATDASGLIEYTEFEWDPKTLEEEREILETEPQDEEIDDVALDHPEIDEELDWGEFDIMDDMDEFLGPHQEEEMDMLLNFVVPNAEKREIIDYQLLDEWDEIDHEEDLEAFLEEEVDEEVEQLRKDRLEMLEKVIEPGWNDEAVVIPAEIPERSVMSDEYFPEEDEILIEDQEDIDPNAEEEEEEPEEPELEIHSKDDELPDDDPDPESGFPTIHEILNEDGPVLNESATELTELRSPADKALQELEEEMAEEEPVEAENATALDRKRELLAFRKEQMAIDEDKDIEEEEENLGEEFEDDEVDADAIVDEEMDEDIEVDEEGGPEEGEDPTDRFQEEEDKEEMQKEDQKDFEETLPVTRKQVKAMLMDVEDGPLWDGLPENMLKKTVDSTGYKEIKATQKKQAEEAHKSEDPLIQIGWDKIDPEFAEYLKQKQQQTLHQQTAQAKYDLEQVVRRRQMTHYLTLSPAQFDREKRRLKKIIGYRLAVLNKQPNKGDVEHAEIKKYNEWKSCLDLAQIEFVQKMFNSSDSEMEQMQELAKAEQKKQIIKSQRDALAIERAKQGPFAIPLPEFIDSWTDDHIFRGLGRLAKKIENLQTDKQLTKEEQYDLRHYSRIKKALETILTMTTIDKATNYQPFLEALSDDQLFALLSRVKEHVSRFKHRVHQTPAGQKPIAQKYWDMITSLRDSVAKLIPPTYYQLKLKDEEKTKGLEQNISKRDMDKLIDKSKDDKEKEIESEIKIGKLRLYAFDEDTTPVTLTRKQVEYLADILPRTHDLIRQLKATFFFRRVGEEPNVWDPLFQKLQTAGSLEVFDGMTLAELMKDSDFSSLEELQHICSKEYRDKNRPVVDKPDFVNEFPDPLIRGNEADLKKKFYEDKEFNKKARQEEIEFLTKWGKFDAAAMKLHPSDEPETTPQQELDSLEKRRQDLLKEREEIEEELAKETDAEAIQVLERERDEVNQELEECEDDKKQLQDLIKDQNQLSEEDAHAELARKVAHKEPSQLPLDGLTEFQKAVLINHQANYGGSDEVNELLVKVAKRLHEYNQEKQNSSASAAPVTASTSHAAPVGSPSEVSATPAASQSAIGQPNANPLNLDGQGFTPRALKMLKDVGMEPNIDPETLRRQEALFKKIAESTANFLKQSANQEEFLPKDVLDILDPKNHVLNLMEMKWHVKDDGLYQGRRHVLEKKLKEMQRKAVLSASMRAPYQALGEVVKAPELTQEYPFQFTFVRRAGLGMEHEKLAERKVIMRIKVAALNLPPVVRDRLVQLAGRRYSHKTGTLKLVMDKFAYKHYNTYGVKKVFRDLLDEAWKADPNYVPLEQAPQPQFVHELVRKLHGEAKENKNYFVFNTAYIPILQNTPPAVIQ